MVRSICYYAACFRSSHYHVIDFFIFKIGKHFIKISFDETTNPPKIIQKVRGKQKINKDLIYVVIFCKKELEVANFYICTQGDIQKIVDKNYRAHLVKVDSVRPKNPKSPHCTYKEKDLLKFEDNWDLILKT